MATVDISINDFLFECSDNEIEKIIKYLRKEGYLEEENNNIPNSTIWEDDFNSKLDNLRDRYHSISNEDMEVLEKVFKKYNF